MSKKSDKVVGVVAKTSNPDAQRIAKELISWLKERQIQYALEESTFNNLDLETADLLKRDELTRKCDVVVVLGGDGTLISVCRHPSTVSPVIIGVNLGTLGFLTEITVSEMLPTLESVLNEQATTENRALLLAKIYRADHEPEQAYAMNDIVVSKEALARIFPVRFSVEGEFAAVLKGDGLIVATPAGSTAYSMAAGGSIVHPQVDAILVTPICSHSLTTRPLVLPGDREVEIEIEGKIEEPSVFLTIDGQTGFSLQAGDRVTINTSSRSLSFAKSPSRSYFEVLGTKLKWATQ